MTPLERDMLLTFAPILVGWGFREIVAMLHKHQRLEALAGVAQAAEDAVNAGIAAGPGGRAAAVAAAKAAVLADLPNVEKSLEAELDVLLAGHVAQLTTTPGGATVSLPNLGTK
jgi:hypothetical protein